MAGGLLGLVTPASADVQDDTVHSSVQTPGGKLLGPPAGTPANDDHGDHGDGADDNR
ncbi:hypothetical protein ACIBQX_00915 [Nonomuraea sp. NPDC049714]|uniref:hypothetical protein n=1 Tax=Nonomuraea sp. NPDC049714 TaxID=3364357 RepID=UPI0037B42E30